MRVEIEDETAEEVLQARDRITKEGASLSDFLTKDEYNAIINAIADRRIEQNCYKETRELVFGLIDRGYHIYELCKACELIYNELKAEVKEKIGVNISAMTGSASKPINEANAFMGDAECADAIRERVKSKERESEDRRGKRLSDKYWDGYWKGILYAIEHKDEATRLKEKAIAGLEVIERDKEEKGDTPTDRLINCSVKEIMRIELWKNKGYGLNFHTHIKPDYIGEILLESKDCVVRLWKASKWNDDYYKRKGSPYIVGYVKDE